MRRTFLIILMCLIFISTIFVANLTTNSSTSEDTTDSVKFADGYRDAWNFKRKGAIYWILNKDYRQGHMIGIYDKENNKEKQY